VGSACNGLSAMMFSCPSIKVKAARIRDFAFWDGVA
jgi:hypothetical protein